MVPYLNWDQGLSAAFKTQRLAKNVYIKQSYTTCIPNPLT